MEKFPRKRCTWNFFCSGWRSRRVHVCQVSKWNFQGLQFYRRSNFPCFLLILNGPYNSASLLRCLWLLAKQILRHAMHTEWQTSNGLPELDWIMSSSTVVPMKIPSGLAGHGPRLFNIANLSPRGLGGTCPSPPCRYAYGRTIANIHRLVKFRVILSSRWKDMNVFYFLKWPPAAILNF